MEVLKAKLPKKSNPFGKLKSFDPAILPPCCKSLEYKLRRVDYASHFYRNAQKSSIDLWDPTNHGWDIKEGRVSPVWFDGDHIPGVSEYFKFYNDL